MSRTWLSVAVYSVIAGVAGAASTAVLMAGALLWDRYAVRAALAEGRAEVAARRRVYEAKKADVEAQAVIDPVDRAELRLVELALVEDEIRFGLRPPEPTPLRVVYPTDAEVHELEQDVLDALASK